MESQNEKLTYHSTREGPAHSSKSFLEVLRLGLADDGGLFVPSHIPYISQSTQQRWRQLSYRELCFEVVRVFVSPEEIPTPDLQRLIQNAYSQFRVPECVRVRSAFPAENNVPSIYFMELFHGPSYAFKDFALQFLAQLFKYILDTDTTAKDISVLAATSGDTGSAAILSLEPIERVKTVVLYPAGKISRIQELQMTSVDCPRVCCLALEGASFDDCQCYVKKLFNSPLRTMLNLCAVNSINWARILAQMAAYYAKRMGAPLRTLIIASNTNDILTRFWTTGIYKKDVTITPTASPSMDIQISSNFERLLYYLYLGDGIRVQQKFGEELSQKNVFDINDPEAFQRLRQDFRAFSCSDDETAGAIRDVYIKSSGGSTRLVMDTHTAVGYVAAMKYLKDPGRVSRCPLVIAATAHYAKFIDFVSEALPDKALRLNIPAGIRDVMNCSPLKRIICQNELADVLRGMRTFLVGSQRCDKEQHLFLMADHC